MSSPRVRREKLAALQGRGRIPSGKNTRFDWTPPPQQIKENFEAMEGQGGEGGRPPS